MEGSPMSNRFRSYLLLALCLAFPAAAAEELCDRVVAVGDIHGGYDAFVNILLQTGIIDEDLVWRDDRACLVQLGDVVDRGPRSREVLDFLIDLQRQAPQRVHPLLGNHEAMNITGDLRYVSLGEYAAFVKEEPAGERAAALMHFSSFEERKHHTAKELQELFDAVRPPGWFGHQYAFSEQGKYGAWLLANRTLEIINHTLFVHGGISLHDAARGIIELNRELPAQIVEYTRLRTYLIDCGWWDPYLEPRAAFERLLEKAASAALLEQSVVSRLTTRRFVELFKGAIFRASDGPLWNRDLALQDLETLGTELEQLLNLLNVDRIVVGHSTTEDGNINSRFDRRVYMIDTGAGPAYDGQSSALELSRNDFIWAIYPHGSELLVDPRPADEVTESRLKYGEVIRIEHAQPDSVALRKVIINHNDQTFPTLFRSHRPNESPDEVAAGAAHEMAAYLLDRHLDLGLVAVSAARMIEGESGVLIGMPSGVIDGHRLSETYPVVPNPGRFEEERNEMLIFDALIGNLAREAGTRLYSEPELKLMLIDHTRSFGLQTELLAELPLKMPASCTRIMLALASLEFDELQGLLCDLVDEHAIRALLTRRDALLARFTSSP
jgi:hypothetical protein